MNLRVYNTLSKQKENFEPVRPGHVGIYLCGPTVYKEAHIGHMVGPVIFDAIKRYLTYCGFQVTWVVNITDVDDKLIAESQRRGITMAQVAEENTVDYLNNLQALGVMPGPDGIDHLPKATEHIDEIIRFIETLIERRYAYASDGDVYFEVARDADYGKLSNRSAESLIGEGGDAVSRKRAAGDFALWKSAKPGEPSWPSPWGPGRPGWHIECSAMSRRLLGETFDIHGGGLDLVFPHHENEVAQSESCHDKPMVKYWLHNGLMKAAPTAGKVGGRGERATENETATDDVAGKISRSKGAGGLADLIKKHGGELLRFFLLRTHYRSTSVFGDDPLAESAVALEAFYRLFQRYERVTGKSFYETPIMRRRGEGNVDAGEDPLLADVRRRREEYHTKMDDDFNTGGAVSELFELVRSINRYIDQEKLDEATQRTPERLATLRRAAGTLRELTAILGLFQKPIATIQSGDDELVGKLMQLLIEIRATARKNKDFATSDKVRNDLTAMGIALEDRKEGTTWTRAK